MTTFDEASICEGKRQDFLDQFFGIHPSTHVQRIIYDPDFKARDEWIERESRAGGFSQDKIQDYLAGLRKTSDIHMGISPLRNIGDGVPRPIWVAPSAFLIMTEQGLVHALRDHEYVHAQDYCIGVPFNGFVLDERTSNIFSPQIFNSFLEVRAYHRQVKAIKESKARTLKDKSFDEGRDILMRTGREYIASMFPRGSHQKEWDPYLAVEALKIYGPELDFCLPSEH